MNSPQQMKKFHLHGGSRDQSGFHEAIRFAWPAKRTPDEPLGNSLEFDGAPD
ncbi:MAG: hypothetical protein U1F70_14590 [Candidatus Competibacteraceae bacterium]